MSEEDEAPGTDASVHEIKDSRSGSGAEFLGVISWSQETVRSFCSMGGWNVHHARRFDGKKRKRGRNPKTRPGSGVRSLLKPERSEIKEPIKGQWVKRFADDLHKKMTVGELAFWRLISRQKEYHCHYYPQFPLYGYITDFYCPRHRVAVELDGGYHTDKKQKAYDLNRDNSLRGNGICVIRLADTTDEKVLLGYVHRVREICRMRR